MLKQIEMETFSIEMELMTTGNTFPGSPTTSACSTDNRQSHVEKNPPSSTLFGCFPTSHTCWYKHLPCSPWAVESTEDAGEHFKEGLTAAVCVVSTVVTS